MRIARHGSRYSRQKTGAGKVVEGLRTWGYIGSDAKSCAASSRIETQTHLAGTAPLPQPWEGLELFNKVAEHDSHVTGGILRRRASF